MRYRPKRKERRKFRRMEAKIKVAFPSKEALAVEYTKNLSRGGIFLKTGRLLDPNAEVDLMLTFPEGLGEHQIRGKITRTMSMSNPKLPGEQIHGVGIRFLDAPVELLQAIEKVIGEKQ